MEGSTSPRIKICCISSEAEAKTAIKFGASALGLVGKMPSGPGIIDDQLIKSIAVATPPPISTWLLTSETSTKAVIKHFQKVNTSAIQIVDKLDQGSYQEIKTALPNIKLIQVIHVIDQSSIEEAIALSSFVDAILLDSGNPNAKVKILGGTGKTHNWKISRQIRAEIPIPLFLAGGLNSSNVREAIDTVQPFGLDLCSGLRTDGKLDESKLKAFFEAVNSRT